MSRVEEAINRGNAMRGDQAAGPADRPSSLDRDANEPVLEADDTMRRTTSSTEQPVHRVVTPEAAGDDGGGDQLIDVHQLARYARFGATSVRRRKFLAIGTFMLVAGATVAAVAVWPRTYHVYARLLAQKNGVMSALSNPARAIPPDADSPTRAAGEVILKRDNLEALITKTDLLRRWDQTRAPILTLKDRLFARIWGEPSPGERREALIGLLEKRLVVSVGLEDTVSISIDWPDRQLAYELVQISVQNFLDARRIGEMSTIAESVSILEQSAASLEREVDGTYVEVRSEVRSRPRVDRGRVETESSLAASRPAALVPPEPPPLPNARPSEPAPPVENPEVTRLRAAVESKRQELARLEESRRQELSQVQAQLASSLSLYTEKHPTVIGLRQHLASLAVESPQLPRLRTETGDLEAQYESAASVAATPAAPVAAAPAPSVAATPAASVADAPVTSTTPTVADQATDVVSAPPRRATEVPIAAPVPGSAGSVSSDPLDETGNPLTMRLKSELAQLGDLRARLESARIELATSQAAFKYRYNVLHPPQLPRAPAKPNVPAVLLAGLLGAFVLALVAPAGAEIIGGRRADPPGMARRLATPAMASSVGSPGH